LFDAPSRSGILRLKGSKRGIDGSGRPARGEAGKKPGDVWWMLSVWMDNEERGGDGKKKDINHEWKFS